MRFAALSTSLLALSSCGAANGSAADTSALDRAVSTIPSAFLGRWEATPSDCRISVSEREKGEPDIEGSLILIEPSRIYFVEWSWPVRSVAINGPRDIIVQLENDADADGKSLTIQNERLILDNSNALRFGDTKANYTRCGDEA